MGAGGWAPLAPITLTAGNNDNDDDDYDDNVHESWGSGLVADVRDSKVLRVYLRRGAVTVRTAAAYADPTTLFAMHW